MGGMAKTYDGLMIEVVNWGEYNPRMDSKKPSWFRMENTFITGPKFFSLNAGQKLLGLLMFSLVSQSNGKPVLVDYSYLKTFIGIDEEAIFKALQFYISTETLRVSRARPARLLGGSGRNLPATDETDETDETKSEIDSKIIQSLNPEKTKKLAKELGQEIKTAGDEWIKTLSVFGIVRELTESEKFTLGRILQIRIYKDVVWSIIGARYEEKTADFDPSKFLSLGRIFKPNNFDRLMNLGAMNQNSKHLPSTNLVNVRPFRSEKEL